MAENDIGAALDHTISSLRDGIHQLGIEAALPVIEGWEERLSALDSPELAAVAENLAALRSHLSADDFDPNAVGRLLITLGKQVQVVANGPAGTQAGMERLTRLSILLARQGESLSGR
ncbi:MAG TPA: hypothetical protein VFG99_11210 [Chloroflexia bacterium]|nr:hypothetical protein [Chloroflexia bacterium]